MLNVLFRFSFDGTRINEGDTPKSLDMEDGDTIEVNNHT